MAADLGMTPPEYDDLCGNAEIRRLISLDTPLDEEGGATIGDQVADDAVNMLDEWIEGERADEVRAAVERLPDRERTVVQLYYMRGYQLKEIGETLGVTESRVCQISKAAVGRLTVWLRRVDAPRRRQPATP